jgi:hypothetical protein
VLAGGAAILYAQIALRDGDGYFSSRTTRLATEGRALVTAGIDLTDLPGGSDRWASVRVRARLLDGGALFIGIARRADLDRYLADVRYDEVTDVHLDSFTADYDPHEGRRPPAPPASRGFWGARVQGRGEQTLVWHVTGGDWQIVAMRADGGPGVAVAASLGVRVSYVLAFGIGFVVVGLLILAGGVAMLVAGARKRRRPPEPPGEPAPPANGGPPPGVAPGA